MKPIEVQSLKKTYGTVQALNGVSFEVEPGTIFGLIGPDGAGKTSLIRILATLLKPTEGEARIMGLDVVKDYKAIRHQIGYMPGRFSLYPDLSVEENLRLFARLYGTDPKANRGLVEEIYSQIEPFKHRRAGALSGGMKQKLALSCALIHRPKVLLLDEPTTGVDVVSRQELWDLLGKLRQEGITLLVSTPYMDEAARCDRVALIQEGQFLRIGTPSEIVKTFDKPLFEVETLNLYGALLALRSWPHTDSVFPFGETLHFTDSRSVPDPEGVAQYLQKELQAEVTVRKAEPNIEDVFMRFMGQPTAPV